MTNQEILEKAIEKAIAGGYKPDGIDSVTNYRPTIRNGQAWVRWFNDVGHEVIQDLEHVIYSHQFAKVLWPPAPETKCPYCFIALFSGLRHPVPCPFSQMVIGDTQLWKWHLQQMVIADDPIKYLGENLPVNK